MLTSSTVRAAVLRGYLSTPRLASLSWLWCLVGAKLVATHISGSGVRAVPSDAGGSGKMRGFLSWEF